jgi:hypothetical protein
MDDKFMNERMVRVETNIDNIKEDVDEIKTILKKNNANEKNQFAEMEEKFAAKWVQTAFVTLLIGIIITVISILI